MRAVLFIDNDPYFLDTRAEFLENTGYRVLKAYTLEQARQLLVDARVHLAILDMRIVDDDDERDTSGLTLAKDPAYRTIPKIMLTGFPSYQYVREALGPALDGLPPAVAFLAKKEGPKALIQAVEQAFAQYVRINWDLHIRWDERQRLSFPHLVSLVEPDLDSARLPDRAGELEDLFRKLFYEKPQITIGRLLWRREGRACVTVFAYSAEGTLEQRIVICGLRPELEQESALCREFAPRGGIGTALAGFAETMHFAAMAYALPEADLEQAQTFETLYRMNQAAQVRVVLKHLFQTTLAAWHQGGRILEEARSLGQLYRERLNLGWEEIPQEGLQRRMEALAKEALSLSPTRIELSAKELTLEFPNGEIVCYPNPVPYLYGKTEDGGLPVVCRITPGTLTGDSILVDQDGQTWLTDFAQAGSAPLLWDFVSLEAIIRFDLVDSTSLTALHEFEKRLVAPSRLNDRLDTEDVDPQFRKALGVIQEIRRLAFYSAGGDPTPYYEGLLSRAMSSVAGNVPDLRHTRRELSRLVHALIAAAMICGGMKGMTEKERSSGDPPLPPPGIEIDEASRQVWVEGRRVTLSSSEFGVFLHLYTNAGQLCSRRSIIEEGLGEEYVGDKPEAGRINTIMARLRKRIEPDPGDPCYITTIRGEGYILCLADKDRS